jgi:hypothetical protein
MQDGVLFFEPRPQTFLVTWSIVALSVLVCQHVMQLPFWQRRNGKVGLLAWWVFVKEWAFMAMNHGAEFQDVELLMMDNF